MKEKLDELIKKYQLEIDQSDGKIKEISARPKNKMTLQEKSTNIYNIRFSCARLKSVIEDLKELLNDLR